MLQDGKPSNNMTTLVKALNLENSENNLNTSLHSSQLRPNSIVYSVIGAVTLSLISLLVVLFNLRLICIVTDAPRKKLRPIKLLVIHLSSISIGFSFILGLYAVEKLSIVGKTGQWVCMLTSLGRNGLYAAYPFNIAAIMYERLWTFRNTSGKLLVGRTIFLIWIVALVESFPTLFMVNFELDEKTQIGLCKRVPLFGSEITTAIYAIIRFLLLHVLVVGYMSYALFKIRSKIKCLYIIRPIPSRRIIGNVRRLRFVCIYSFLYILVWAPTGVLVVGYSVLGRAGVDFQLLKGCLAFIFVINYIFMIISPLLFLYLNEDNTKIYWLCSCCYKQTFSGVSTPTDTNRNEDIPGNNDLITENVEQV